MQLLCICGSGFVALLFYLVFWFVIKMRHLSCYSFFKIMSLLILFVFIMGAQGCFSLLSIGDPVALEGLVFFPIGMKLEFTEQYVACSKLCGAGVCFLLHIWDTNPLQLCSSSWFIFFKYDFNCMVEYGWMSDWRIVQTGLFPGMGFLSPLCSSGWRLLYWFHWEIQNFMLSNLTWNCLDGVFIFF